MGGRGGIYSCIYLCLLAYTEIDGTSREKRECGKIVAAAHDVARARRSNLARDVIHETTEDRNTSPEDAGGHYFHRLFIDFSRGLGRAVSNLLFE